MESRENADYATRFFQSQGCIAYEGLWLRGDQSAQSALQAIGLYWYWEWRMGCAPRAESASALVPFLFEEHGRLHDKAAIFDAGSYEGSDIFLVGFDETQNAPDPNSPEFLAQVSRFKEGSETSLKIIIFQLCDQSKTIVYVAQEFDQWARQLMEGGGHYKVVEKPYAKFHFHALGL